jgi:Bacterial conjugation TrbI-like protein
VSPDPDQIWQVESAFPGEQTMIYRESATREIVSFSMNPQRRVFRVRAVVTDQGQPMNSSLEEVLSFVPKNRFKLRDGPFAVWKHYGGTKAVFFDLCADSDGNLWAVEVDVSARRPELALGYGIHASDSCRHANGAPLSRYEVKAGWEIPAVLEQSLNSDLPGELKALVTSNVYDTATGLYLLIPQGSRLIGKYDSRVAYGQDGVQVSWNRIIYPDASSVDLDGMIGLDSHGNAGLRDQVDRHYRRIVGFSVLTSMFTAAFQISQRTSQSALTYPTPAQTAGSAVGQELSQTGAQITRRNLNVQPTIKVPAGYKFTVRVNRDILFESPYEPVQPQGRQPSQIPAK